MVFFLQIIVFLNLEYLIPAASSLLLCISCIYMHIVHELPLLRFAYILFAITCMYMLYQLISKNDFHVPQLVFPDHLFLGYFVLLFVSPVFVQEEHLWWYYMTFCYFVFMYIYGKVALLVCCKSDNTNS